MALVALLRPLIKLLLVILVLCRSTRGRLLLRRRVRRFGGRARRSSDLLLTEILQVLTILDKSSNWSDVLAGLEESDGLIEKCYCFWVFLSKSLQFSRDLVIGACISVLLHLPDAL